MRGGRVLRCRPTSTCGSPTSANRSPTSTRRQFDELLGEARLMYRLRDERGVFSDIWASGIMRRAVLAAGRRAENKGRITTPSTSSTPASTRCASLVTGAGRSVGRRARAALCGAQLAYRQGSAAVARAAGTAAARPGRPPAGRRAGHDRGRHRRWVSCSAAPRPRHEGNVLRGLAASGGVYEGPARRVGPGRVRSHRRRRCARHRVDDRGVQHPLAAARRDRHRQRWPAVALGDRGAEYGIPGVVGTRERDRPDRRRHACAHRRRCR